MKGMSKAVQRLAQAVLEQQKVTLYGDYDVDGATNTATLDGGNHRDPQRLQLGEGGLHVG